MKQFIQHYHDELIAQEPVDENLQHRLWQELQTQTKSQKVNPRSWAWP